MSPFHSTLTPRGRWLRFFQGRSRSTGVIHMSHSVAVDPVDPWSPCVAPEHFDDHPWVLRSEFNVFCQDFVGLLNVKSPRYFLHLRD